MIKKQMRKFLPSLERLKKFVELNFEEAVGSLVNLRDLWLDWRTSEGDEQAQAEWENSAILTDMISLGYRVSMCKSKGCPEDIALELVGWRPKTAK